MLNIVAHRTKYKELFKYQLQSTISKNLNIVCGFGSR